MQHTNDSSRRNRIQKVASTYEVIVDQRKDKHINPFSMICHHFISLIFLFYTTDVYLFIYTGV